MSIKEVADAIVKAVGFQGQYTVGATTSIGFFSLSLEQQFDTTRADGQFRKPASNAKLLNLIGGFQFTPFELGTEYNCCWLCLLANGCFSALDTTVKWFLENYETARTGMKK